MKARLIEHGAPGGKRAPLEDNLPLCTPYVVQFFPIYACNFRCRYCHFSVPKEERCFVTDRVAMSMALYKKCVHDLAMFPDKIRTLRFVGMGEPLLHPDIVEMVRLAKVRGVANTVEMLTNGSLLDNSKADGLIDACLDRLVISIQGVSTAGYFETSGVKLDFCHFVDQLAYFYKKKRHTHVYIKIVDVALHGDTEKEIFLKTFGDISDSIGIESAVPIFTGVAYNDELSKKPAVTQFGTEVLDVPICPQPFYTLQVNPDGKVVGCHSIAYPTILGDCNNNSIEEIWNGEKYNSFRRRMLKGRDRVCEICRDCGINTFRMQPEDLITNKDGSLNVLY